MTEQEVKLVVELTISSLIKRNMIADHVSYSVVSKDIEPLLTDYFNGAYNVNLSTALKAVSGDEYYCIIPMIYNEGLTLEHIADRLDKDTSTIKRNKKRLLCKIWSVYNGRI